MKTKLGIAAALLSVLLFIACGGDDALNTSTFDLTALDTKTMTINVEGNIKASNTVDVTGFIAQTYLGTEEVEGVQAHKQRVNIELNQSDGATTNTETTEYTSQGIPLKVSKDDGVTCLLANTPSPLPTNAAIGYVSSPILMMCDNGDFALVIISLEASGSVNGKVRVSEEGTEDGQKYSETRLWIITPDMDIVSYHDNTQYSDGSSVELGSTSINQ